MAQPMRKRLVRRETRGVRFVTFSCFRRLPLLSNPRIADRFAAELSRLVGRGAGGRDRVRPAARHTPRVGQVDELEVEEGRPEH